MSEKITSDVYDISSMISTIQSKYNDDIDKNTLTMSIFGHITESLTKIAQNSVIASSEWGNEAIYLRSKFERTILSNAIFFDINNINAIPPKMEVMFGFLESELIEKMGKKNHVIIDKNIPIIIDEYEFHLDYDMQVSRTLLKDGKYAYSAMYILDNENPISGITNPFLSSPIKMTVNFSSFIFINCSIRQVYRVPQQVPIQTDNFIENKTLDFDFTNQLAYFTISADKNGTTTLLTPVFDNMPPDDDNYCFYRYIDEDTIRVKFDPKSYSPTSSTKITVTSYTTTGSEGNFTYKDDIQISLESDKYGYDNFMCLIRPVTDSEGGVDKKSVDELKRLIPKQASSRRVITKSSDLQNYLNNLDSYKLYFYQKRMNQIENLFYAYILMMDSSNNIVPTNTVNVLLNKNDFDMINENRYILPQGKMLKYDDNGCTILHDTSTEDALKMEDSGFLYTIPFTTVINSDNILSVSYYCSNISNKKYFNYSYINGDSSIQFICNYITMRRHYLENDDNYICDIDILQNVKDDFNLVTVDTEAGKITGTKLKAIIVISNGNSDYYLEGELIEYDATNFIYKFRFTLNNDNMIDSSNRVRINKVHQVSTSKTTYSYFGREVNAKVYVYMDSDTYYGNNGVNIFPNIVDGYTLTNVYSTIQPLELFINYSETVDSVVKTIQNTDGSPSFKITSVPVVRHSYFNNVDRSTEFLENLALKKAYIDDALSIIENPMSIDLKFFNTYGKSKLFYIGYNKELLDRVNLRLTFRVKLVTGADDDTITYIKESIKDYIEDINSITSRHMNNLTTKIKNDYDANIEFIEFVGINNYDATYQYIERMEVSEISDVPEFVSINSKDDYSISDINIISV